MKVQKKHPKTSIQLLLLLLPFFLFNFRVSRTRTNKRQVKSVFNDLLFFFFFCDRVRIRVPHLKGTSVKDQQTGKKKKSLSSNVRRYRYKDVRNRRQRESEKKKKTQLKSIDTGKRQKVNTTALDKNLPPQRVFTHKEAIYPTN